MYLWATVTVNLNRSWALWMLNSQAKLAGTVAHLTETKTAALMKAGVLFESIFGRAHLSGWANSQGDMALSGEGDLHSPI